MPDPVYSTKARNDSILSDDGLTNLKLALPRTLSDNGDATNPEQLLAQGPFTVLHHR